MGGCAPGVGSGRGVATGRALAVAGVLGVGSASAWTESQALTRGSTKTIPIKRRTNGKQAFPDVEDVKTPELDKEVIGRHAQADQDADDHHRDDNPHQGPVIFFRLDDGALLHRVRK
jgi:hypothetical protein